MELLNYYPKPKYLIIGSFKGPLGKMLSVLLLSLRKGPWVRFNPKP